MKRLALFVGLLITTIGILGVVAPTAPLQLARSLLTPAALYVIAALRVFLGVLFVWVAPSSRVPRLLRALGVLIIIAGLATPFFGVERSLLVINWLSSQGGIFMRIVMGIATLLGLFIVYAVAPHRRA